MRSSSPNVSSSGVQLTHLPSAADDGSTAADGDSPAARLVDQGQGPGSADDTGSTTGGHFSLLMYSSAHGRKKSHFVLTVQGRVYNFLERPTGWKCFLYHFTV